MEVSTVALITDRAVPKVKLANDARRNNVEDEVGVGRLC